MPEKMTIRPNQEIPTNHGPKSDGVLPPEPPKTPAVPDNHPEGGPSAQARAERKPNHGTIDIYCGDCTHAFRSRVDQDIIDTLGMATWKIEWHVEEGEKLHVTAGHRDDAESKKAIKTVTDLIRVVQKNMSNFDSADW